MGEGGKNGNDDNGPGSPPRKSRTQAERRAEAERRMLQAGLRLLAEKGFGGLTLNEVGEAAGYSRGLPAHYFGRKDDLLAAMARYIVSRFVKGLRSQREEDRILGLRGILRGAEHYLTVVARDPTTMRALLVILTQATSHPELFPSVIALNRGSVEAFAEQIRLGQDSGEIRPDIDPPAQAALILGQLRGVVAQWLIDPETIDLEKIRAALSDSLTRSLAA